VRHGVDSNLFHPADASTGEERLETRRRLGIGPEEIAVLFVGAFDRKGLSTILDAVALLDAGTIGRVKLVAAGSGSRDRFVELARGHGIADRLVFAGYQKEIAAYYRAADLFLFPTLYEPFGMAILEAMSSGLPSIVSRRAGAAELMIHGESGHLIENPADAREIAAALARLIGDPAARGHLGREARRVAGARSWDSVAREYAAVLAPLMDRPPPAGPSQAPGRGAR
jgi:UDP-glucose:(heptosyl)LPS alpha-1,3-glucosyltransferase